MGVVPPPAPSPEERELAARSWQLAERLLVPLFKEWESLPLWRRIWLTLKGRRRAYRRLDELMRQVRTSQAKA